MGLVTIILVGLIAGALAKFLMPGDDPGGFVVTILIGIAGAVAASAVGGLIGLDIAVGEFSVAGILSATAGAFGLLFVYRALT